MVCYFGYKFDWNFCIQNGGIFKRRIPELRETATKQMAEWFEKHPKRTSATVGIWSQDAINHGYRMPIGNVKIHRSTLQQDIDTVVVVFLIPVSDDKDPTFRKTPKTQKVRRK